MQEIALYRKYRPENFDQVVGQDHINRVLKNAILKNKISHAYLFSGPRGTGKTSVARVLAKAINCRERKGPNPCSKCPSCTGIAEGRIMDLIEIDAASNRGIDEIRDLREKVKFSPTDAEFKVFIIDEVHMLTKEAFNALLKTLEEPPEHAIFILATTEINKVPATIISRCQRHDFRRIKLSDIVSLLSEIKKKEKIKISDEALEVIAETSEGGLRDAESLLDQIASTGLVKIEVGDIENILGLAPHKMVYSFVESLLLKNEKDSLLIIEKALKNGVDLINLTKSSIEVLRKITVAKMGGTENLEGTKEQIELLKDISEKADTEKIISVSDLLIWGQSVFKTNVEPKAILTIICAKNRIEINRIQENISVKNEETKTNVSNQEKNVKEGIPKRKPNGNWQHLLMEVKAKNNAIHACLRVASPEFSGDDLILTFPYKFHKEQIEAPRNKKVVKEMVQKVYGGDIEIKFQLTDSSKSNDKITDINNAASILGGKVVEEN